MKKITLRMLRLTMSNQNIWGHARGILSEVREQPTHLFPAELFWQRWEVILTEAMWANDKLLAPKKMKILENCIAIFLHENESNEAN